MAPSKLANITKVKTTLLLLAQSTPSAMKKILKDASGKVIRAICEIALNCLNGAVPLTRAQKARLKRFKKPMRDLNAPGRSLLDKRQLAQRGGFLSTLLGVALPLVIKGVSKLVGIIKQRKRARRGRKK